LEKFKKIAEIPGKIVEAGKTVVKKFVNLFAFTEHIKGYWEKSLCAYGNHPWIEADDYAIKQFKGLYPDKELTAVCPVCGAAKCGEEVIK